MCRTIQNSLIVWSGILVLSLGQCAIAAINEEKEQIVALDQLPKAVVDAVRLMFPKAEMIKATIEEQDADDASEDKSEDDRKNSGKSDRTAGDKQIKPKSVYEITLKENGQAIDVTVEEAGEIQEIERPIELKDLPQVVTDALAKKFPNSTLKSAEVIYEVEDGEPELEGYEVVLESAEKKEIEAEVELEVEISVEG